MHEDADETRSLIHHVNNLILRHAAGAPANAARNLGE
jgi:hypothetical protein